MRKYFMESDRIGFSEWTINDIDLAEKLWGNPSVTRYICKSGIFSNEDIRNRLNTEIENGKINHVQYWPIFEKNTSKLLGCCGLRPFKNEQNSYEIGFHLCEDAWGKGYATEAANAVIKYAYDTLNADIIYAGHHPDNVGSKRVLMKLGFTYIGDNYYAPTGLNHPSYEMKNHFKSN